MIKQIKQRVGCMRKYHSIYKLYDGTPMPNWNYDPKASVESGVEIPYYDFNANGKLDKANTKLWLNALLRQTETGYNNLTTDQLDRIKYYVPRNKHTNIRSSGSYKKITAVDIINLLNSGI